jgi:hypothetical protein
MKRRGPGGSGKRRRREKGPPGPSPRWPEKPRILIVCEGRETEPNYLHGLRDERAVRQNFIVEVRKGKGGSRIAIVQQAVVEREKAAARRKGFDEVWCVFDVEHPGRREQVIQARNLADQHGIQVALSNPAFECWLLAHFVRTKRSFADGDAVIAELNKHWRPEFGRNYEKNDDELYARLKDRVQTALDNARRVREQDWASSLDIVDCNSATDIYQLVERLLRPPE